MPTQVSTTIMDTKAFIQQVLNEVEATGDYHRRAWDSFWRAVLQHILEGGQVPTGAAPEIILSVQKLLRERQSQTKKVAELYPAFYETNRSSSLAFSELWCNANYSNGYMECFHTATRGQQQHAEMQALQRLQWQMENTTMTPRDVIFYMNVSPCRNCAEAIRAYKEDHPETTVTVKFTSLFAHHAPNHRRGLQRMAESGVRLAVFDDGDWDLLSSVIHTNTIDSNRKAANSVPKRSKLSDEEETWVAEPSRKKLRVQT